MRELFEALFSIAIPAVALIGYALLLARREDPGLKIRSRKTPGVTAFVGSDPDAHLGRTGTE